MSNAAQPVVLEKSGQVRDMAGRHVGDHDPEADAKEFRSLNRYVGDVSRARMSMRELAIATGDVRHLASPMGDLAPADAQTSPTAVTSMVPEIDAVADLVCPVTLVTKTSGTWLSESAASVLAKPEQPQLAGIGSTPQIAPTLVSAGYDANNALALSVVLPTEVIANADLDLVKLSARRLVNAFKLNREVRVANLLTTSTNFPSGNRTAASVKWNGVTPVPLTDLYAALAKSLIPPTHMLFTEPAARWWFSATEVFQYTVAGGPLPQIVVAKMRKVVSAAVSYVWGAPTSASAILVYAGPDPESVSTARTFRYVGDAPDREAALESNGYMLRSYFDRKHGARGARSLVLVTNEVDSVLDGTLGGIITGVLA